MNAHPNTARIVASAVMAFFMVFVLFSSALAAAAPSAAGTTHTVWAYGYVKTASVGPLHTMDGWQYQGSSVIGYAVILNETNLSSTAFELAIHRTMGAYFSIQFCNPTCGSDSSFSNLSVREYESAYSWANFTTQGSVHGLLGPVPAIALVNASSSVTANVTESAHSELPSMHGGMVDRSGYLSAAVSSLASVSFSPSLGLLPLNLTPGLNWQATSAFNASGSSQYSYYYSAHGPARNVTVGPASGEFTVAPTGNVTVTGTYNPLSVISFGGASFPAIALTVTGPFSVREGMILIPSAADLFGSSTHPWAANQNSSTTVQMASLDAKPYANGHFGLEASSWMYSSTTANPAEALGSTSGVYQIAPAAVNMNPVASNTIQGTPEAVSQAQSDSNCLTAGVGCPSNAPVSRALLTAIGVGVVVVGVGGLIAAVLIADRRRLPPPVYPNANLYPPGMPPSPSATLAGRPVQTPVPPAEEDPLDHLW